MDTAVELEQKPAVGYWSVVGARPCDACAAEPARLHCREDGAFLCPGCDARAHGAGSRHARVWLCEVCEHAPAAVTCRADAAALCAACDADIHSANPLARRHERLPVAPFFGALADAPQPFPSPAFAAAAAAGGQAQGEAAAADNDDDDGSNEAEAASWLLAEPDNSHEDSAAATAADTLFAESDAYLGVDLDFARCMDGVKAIGVPVAPPELDIAAGSFFYPEHSMNHSVSLTLLHNLDPHTHGFFQISQKKICSLFNFVDGGDNVDAFIITVVVVGGGGGAGRAGGRRAGGGEQGEGAGGAADAVP
jgi:hypothetical protein